MAATCLLFVQAARPSLSQDISAPRADVAELMRLSGAANVGQALTPLLVKEFVSALRQSNPILPERTTTVVTEVVSGYLGDPTHMKEVTDQIGEVYARAITPAEIQQLIAFYKTPVGRKLAASQPSITSESAQIGQTWAAKMLPALRETLLARLRSEGLLPRS